MLLTSAYLSGRIANSSHFISPLFHTAMMKGIFGMLVFDNNWMDGRVHLLRNVVCFS